MIRCVVQCTQPVLNEMKRYTCLPIHILLAGRGLLSVQGPLYYLEVVSRLPIAWAVQLYLSVGHGGPRH